VRVAIYHTDGKLACGEDLEIDEETVKILNDLGVWVFVSVGGCVLRFISRFDRVKFKVIGKHSRILAFAEYDVECPGELLRLDELYDAFVRNVAEIVKKQGWKWDEKDERILRVEIQAKSLEEDVYFHPSKYPSIENRKRVIVEFKEEIINGRCFVYSEKEPFGFEPLRDCIWVSSEELLSQNPVTLSLKRLVKAIKEYDWKTVKTLYERNELIKLIKLLRHDSALTKEFYSKFFFYMMQKFNLTAYEKEEMIKYAKTCGFVDWIKDTLSPYLATLDIVEEKRSIKERLLNALPWMLVVLAMIIFVLFVIIPFMGGINL